MSRVMSFAFSIMLAVTSISVASTAALAQGTVTAGGQSCIVTNRIVEKQGYYDRSRVELTNRCPRPVSAYVCVTAVYRQDVRQPCDPRFGGFGRSTWAPGQMTSSGISSSAEAMVVIRECPSGYRPGGGSTTDFPCVR